MPNIITQKKIYKKLQFIRKEPYQIIKKPTDVINNFVFPYKKRNNLI